MTANGTSFQLMGTSTTSYAVIPATEAIPSDYYLFSSNDENLATNENVGISHAGSGGSAVSLALPTPWTNTPPTAALLPTFTFNYTGFAGAPFAWNVAQLSWPASGTTTNDFNVFASAAYVGATGTVTMANLAPVTGFLPAAAASTSINWEAGTYAGTYNYVLPVQTGGTSLRWVQVTGTYTQP
jgi:hypothetical protein